MEVPEHEPRQFAQSIGAIFALTSAKMNTGVDALFEDAGNKYLDPSFQQKVMQEQEANKEEKGQKITLNQDEVKKEKKKKGGFC